jgi:hypothetical protein
LKNSNFFIELDFFDYKINYIKNSKFFEQQIILTKSNDAIIIGEKTEGRRKYFDYYSYSIFTCNEIDFRNGCGLNGICIEQDNCNFLILKKNFKKKFKKR